MSILTGSNLSTQVSEALKQGRTAIGVSLLKGLNISFIHTHHPRSHMTYEFYKNEEWKAFTPKMQAIRREQSSLGYKQRSLMNRVTDLDLVDDLLLHKMGELEGPIPEKQEKQLRKLTGMDSECWYYKYDRCKDAINEMRVAKCLEVSALQSQIQLLDEDWRVLDKEQDACRDRLIKEHNDATKNQGLAATSAA